MAEKVREEGVKYEKWGERPEAIVKGRAGRGEIMEHLTRAVEEGRIAKWLIPDRIIYVDEMPPDEHGEDRQEGPQVQDLRLAPNTRGSLPAPVQLHGRAEQRLHPGVLVVDVQLY